MSTKLVEIAEDSARGGFFLFTGNALSLLILAIGSIIVAGFWNLKTTGCSPSP